MKAQSADYIQLQNIYKARARHDSSQVLFTVRQLEKQIGRPADQAIDEKEVDAFCKGAAHVKLVRGRPLLLSHADQAKKLEWGAIAAKAATDGFDYPAESGILLFIAFLAWDTFISTHSADVLGGDTRVPGLKVEDIESDEEKMVGIAHNILDGVITESGTFIKNPAYDELKESLANISKELYVPLSPIPLPIPNTPQPLTPPPQRPSRRQRTPQHRRPDRRNGRPGSHQNHHKAIRARRQHVRL